MRSGASGGGTFCNGAPQQGHWGVWISVTRIQWPRASHTGLMHCTVQPGKYCMVSPIRQKWQLAPERRRSLA
jgi:hypothetical protein